MPGRHHRHPEYRRVVPSAGGGGVVAGSVAQWLLAEALILAIVGVLWLIEGRVTGRPARHRFRFPFRRRPRPAPQAVGRPIQVVAADLRRLSRQLALVPAGAPLVRWQALWAAYDDVLIEAATELDVPHELPGTPNGMARDLERLRLLAALEGAGLAVRA
jgi:hypothetical protein